VPKISRQHPVPDVGPARRLVLPVSGVTPPGLTPNRASCHRRPPSHVGTGRGAKGHTPCYRCPSIPASQVSPNVQPDCNRSQTRHQVNYRARLQRSPDLRTDFAPAVHNLPTNNFPGEAAIRGLQGPPGPPPGTTYRDVVWRGCRFDYGHRSCCRGSSRVRSGRLRGRMPALAPVGPTDNGRAMDAQQMPAAGAADCQRGGRVVPCSARFRAARATCVARWRDGRTVLRR
jgi:hypothetical protein